MNSKTVYKKLDKEIENLEMENGISYNELQKKQLKGFREEFTNYNWWTRNR